jgi:predicted acetyltransferase
MQLISPSSNYKVSFLQALEEYQKEKSQTFNRDLLLLNIEALTKDFSLYVNKVLDESQGKNLPEGYVSHTTYWLVDNKEFIGRVDIRHVLTETLLREGGHIGYDIRPTKRNQGYGKKTLELALPKAKALGITKVLITCHETNIPSKRIIEANGGVLENSVSMGEGKPKKLRYWIANL